MSSLAIKDALRPIRERFHQSLEVTARDIRNALERALETPSSEQSEFTLIAEKIHKISGTAGTLGYAELGECAHDAEIQINEFLKTGSAPPKDAYFQVLDFLELGLSTNGEED
ncbi:Hpt domain-containing protein [Lentibacter algarum]|uniref:Hpt domain-containing protein n=1 Tax=Lentibacter algarum TaxID=576131 RepID=UPI001C0738D4|nr:Hpt domain-containing protein [Lentibacter algarum]MBU2981453.1 Hpt domain-containing protein [Lentibacter algarum]